MKIVQKWMGIAVSITLLTPVYSLAANEPSQACKDCVLKCVTEKNKEGRECLRVHPAAPGCECDSLCAGVDRKSLMQKLRDDTRAKCKLDYENCMKETGGDAMKQNICNLNKGVCDQRTLKLF